MLVLTRKKSESIVINEDIEITVLEINGDQIKLGIKAPREVEVLRKEIIINIENENNAALNSKMDIKKFL